MKDKIEAVLINFNRDYFAEHFIIYETVNDERQVLYFPSTIMDFERYLTLMKQSEKLFSRDDLKYIFKQLISTVILTSNKYQYYGGY